MRNAMFLVLGLGLTGCALAHGRCDSPPATTSMPIGHPALGDAGCRIGGCHSTEDAGAFAIPQMPSPCTVTP